MSVLDILRGRRAEERSRRQAEQTDAQSIYFDCLRKSIAGEELDPDEVERIIEAAGFTLEDFEARINREERRAELAEHVKRGEQIREKSRANMERRAALQKEIVDAQERWRLQSLEIDTERDRLQYAYRQCLQAETTLKNFPSLEDPVSGVFYADE
ncbi:MAG: hypothetical protein JNL96_14405 [Planctomycetaceae bacterium]|nr:hypothetical protein [Planctomycetaceae bacterium]